MSAKLIPIIVVAFNRPRSLSRLLKSLSKADYPSKDIPLILSIDKAEDNKEVLQIANDFKWNFGEKKVIYQEANLGLRAHIIKCGNLSKEYGSVIILEDDLYVSVNFYNYTEAALKFSEDKSYISGVSLYNHQLNVHTRDNFGILDDGYDNWYFQFASSWGQAWSHKQWSAFFDWYVLNQDLENDQCIPQNVTSWSDKSWLKFFIAYLIQNEKYFFYPSTSLSTNFSDAGTHIGMDSTKFQVPLSFNTNKKFRFSTLDQSRNVYDAFYENQKIHQFLELTKEEITIDLNGYKPKTNAKYLLTTKIEAFKTIKTFGRSLKPIEVNVIENIVGDEIFLYDTTIPDEKPKNSNWRRKLMYNIKYISLNNALKISYFQIFERIKNKLSSGR